MVFFFRFFHRKRTFSWPFHFLFPFTGVPPTITELMWLIVTKFSPASLQSLLSNHKLWECLFSLCFFDVCPVLLPCWLPLCYNISATVVGATSLPRRLDDPWTFQMCADTSCNSFSFRFASCCRHYSSTDFVLFVCSASILFARRRFSFADFVEKRSPASMLTLRSFYIILQVMAAQSCCSHLVVMSYCHQYPWMACWPQTAASSTSAACVSCSLVPYKTINPPDCPMMA